MRLLLPGKPQEGCYRHPETNSYSVIFSNLSLTPQPPYCKNSFTMLSALEILLFSDLFNTFPNFPRKKVFFNFKFLKLFYSGTISATLPSTFEFNSYNGHLYHHKIPSISHVMWEAFEFFHSTMLTEKLITPCL